MRPVNEQATHLLQALRKQGFYRAGNRIVAPHATIWLAYDALPFTDLDALGREAARRLGRKRRHRHQYLSPYDWDCAVEDAEALLDALNDATSRSWQRLAKAS